MTPHSRKLRALPLAPSAGLFLRTSTAAPEARFVVSNVTALKSHPQEVRAHAG